MPINLICVGLELVNWVVTSGYIHIHTWPNLFVICNYKMGNCLKWSHDCTSHELVLHAKKKKKMENPKAPNDIELFSWLGEQLLVLFMAIRLCNFSHPLPPEIWKERHQVKGHVEHLCWDCFLGCLVDLFTTCICITNNSHMTTRVQIMSEWGNSPLCIWLAWFNLISLVGCLLQSTCWTWMRGRHRNYEPCTYDGHLVLTVYFMHYLSDMSHWWRVMSIIIPTSLCVFFS